MLQLPLTLLRPGYSTLLPYGCHVFVCKPYKAISSVSRTSLPYLATPCGSDPVPPVVTGSSGAQRFPSFLCNLPSSVAAAVSIEQEGALRVQSASPAQGKGKGTYLMCICTCCLALTLALPISASTYYRAACAMSCHAMPCHATDDGYLNTLPKICIRTEYCVVSTFYCVGAYLPSHAFPIISLPAYTSFGHMVGTDNCHLDQDLFPVIKATIVVRLIYLFSTPRARENDWDARDNTNQQAAWRGVPESASSHRCRSRDTAPSLDSGQ